MLRTVSATRYVTPFREGGSLPGLMEADDLGSYVVKFHGAGQGRKTLVAEIISGSVARAIGLPVPELVAIEVDPVLGRAEPDQEVQDLLRASGGLNLGMDYLPGALDFDPAAFPLDAALGGRVLWFDALVGNVDRSWRNPNMLQWHGRAYLIDHGASLTFHHNWPGAPNAVAREYDAKDHVLVEFAPHVEKADAELAPMVTPDLLREAAERVPDEWLAGEEGFDGPEQVRRAYTEQLDARLRARAGWLPALAAARPAVRETRPGRNRPDWLAR
ncbi:HipA family kinase [Phytohabitans aurantiacus]|nr:HipA family kinase [Phytohabitans aurantiacus]